MNEPTWCKLFASCHEHLTSSYTGSEEDIRVPETVVFNGDKPVAWFCTPNSEQEGGIGVHKRSEESLTHKKIHDTFIECSSSSESAIIAQMIWYENDNSNPQTAQHFETKRAASSNSSSDSSSSPSKQGTPNNNLRIGYLDERDLHTLLFRKTKIPLPPCWLLQQFICPKKCNSVLVCEVRDRMPASIHNVVNKYDFYKHRKPREASATVEVDPAMKLTRKEAVSSSLRASTVDIAEIVQACLERKLYSTMEGVCWSLYLKVDQGGNRWLQWITPVVDTPSHLRSRGAPNQIRQKQMQQKELDIVQSQVYSTFAGGCFWGLELAFQRLGGVYKTQVGYTGGSVYRPSYEQVCSGSTGHAEAVRLIYEPTKVSYESLLKLFLSKINPRELNRQGNDIGTQYRTVIYYHNESQRFAAKSALDKIDNCKVELTAAPDLFWPAEEYHQRYLEKQGQSAKKGDIEEIRCDGDVCSGTKSDDHNGDNNDPVIIEMTVGSNEAEHLAKFMRFIPDPPELHDGIFAHFNLASGDSSSASPASRHSKSRGNSRTKIATKKARLSMLSRPRSAIKSRKSATKKGTRLETKPQFLLRYNQEEALKENIRRDRLLKLAKRHGIVNVTPKTGAAIPGFTPTPPPPRSVDEIMAGDAKKVTKAGITRISRYPYTESFVVPTDEKPIEARENLHVNPKPRKIKLTSNGNESKKKALSEAKNQDIADKTSGPLLWSQKFGEEGRKASRRGQRADTVKIEGPPSLNYTLLEISDSLVKNALNAFLRSMITAASLVEPVNVDDAQVATRASIGSFFKVYPRGGGSFDDRFLENILYHVNLTAEERDIQILATMAAHAESALKHTDGEDSNRISPEFPVQMKANGNDRLKSLTPPVSPSKASLSHEERAFVRAIKILKSIPNIRATDQIPTVLLWILQGMSQQLETNVKQLISKSSEFTRVGTDCLKTLSQLQSERSSISRRELDLIGTQHTEPIRNWHVKVSYEGENNEDRSVLPSSSLQSPRSWSPRSPSNNHKNNNDEIMSNSTRNGLKIAVDVISDQGQHTPARPSTAGPSFRRPVAPLNDEHPPEYAPVPRGTPPSLAASMSDKETDREYEGDKFDDDVDHADEAKSHGILAIEHDPTEGDITTIRSEDKNEADAIADDDELCVDSLVAEYAPEQSLTPSMLTPCETHVTLETVDVLNMQSITTTTTAVTSSRKSVLNKVDIKHHIGADEYTSCVGWSLEEEELNQHNHRNGTSTSETTFRNPKIAADGRLASMTSGVVVINTYNEYAEPTLNSSPNEDGSICIDDTAPGQLLRQPPFLTMKQRNLIFLSLFSDIAHTVQLKVFSLVKSAWMGRTTNQEAIKFVFGDLAKLLGKYELKEFERWLHANTKSTHSFKLSDSTHTEMALQRSFSFWPQLKIHTNHAQSSSYLSSTSTPRPTTPQSRPSTSGSRNTKRENAYRSSRFKLTTSPRSNSNGLHDKKPEEIEKQRNNCRGCLVQLAWLERHATSRYFKDALTYEPSINLV